MSETVCYCAAKDNCPLAEKIAHLRAIVAELEQWKAQMEDGDGCTCSKALVAFSEPVISGGGCCGGG